MQTLAMVPPTLPLDPGRAAWVERTLAGLTLDQKLGQLVCDQDRRINRLPDPAAWLRQYPVGAVFVGAEIIQADCDHTDAIRRTVTGLRAAAGPVPILFSGDFEHGVGSEVSGLTRFPDLMALGATRDPALAYAYGRAIALEARRLGVRWSFAPVADLNVNPANPVTNQRSVGDDPEAALALLKPHVRGMQEHGMAACAKHFPGDGSDDRNQHNVTSATTLSLARWRRTQGRAFRDLIADGVASIMAGHLAFPAWERPDRRTGRYRPATASRRILTDLLRGELGFEGVIVTDALTMAGFCGWASYEQRIVECFNAGADVFLWPDTERFFETLKHALAAGRAVPERLDASVRRVLRLKAALGLADSAPPAPLERAALEQHAATAAAVAEQSVTLLRCAPGRLPLRPAPGADLLMLVLQNAPVAPEVFAPFRAVFEARGFQATVADFADFKTYRDGLDRYAAVLVLANNGTLNCGGATMRIIGAAAGQLWPFVAHPYPRKVWVSFGNPYVLYEASSADTYLNVYSNGAASQRAAARALLGEIPCRGRSPVACRYAFRRGQGLQRQA